MNYTEIKELALNYADRQDLEVINNIDNFMRVVEARESKHIQVQKQSMRTRLLTSADQEYYGLPGDFNGLRDIEIANIDGTSRSTLAYLNPEQMNLATNTDQTISIEGENAQGYYTIIANQVQIYPPVSDKLLEIVYYQKIPSLTSTETNNWLSDDNPDSYVFGILVEISSFVKDELAYKLWDTRFRQSLEEISKNDKDSRWSGTPLRVRIG